jgi:hypothetical protein
MNRRQAILALAALATTRVLTLDDRSPLQQMRDLSASPTFDEFARQCLRRIRESIESLEELAELDAYTPRRLCMDAARDAPATLDMRHMVVGAYDHGAGQAWMSPDFNA